MRKQLCCHEIWSRDTLGKVPTPTAAEPFKALACLVSRTEPGSETGEQNGWHYANLGNLNRGILQMDRFDVCFFWNLEPLEVGRREVWRSVNDRRTVWVSLGRPTDGEGMLHILVHIYIYIANVNFASQESRIIHFALCQVTCRCNKWSGFQQPEMRPAWHCVSQIKGPRSWKSQLMQWISIWTAIAVINNAERERDHINI